MKNNTKKLINRILGFIYPERCVICDKVISYGNTICDNCAKLWKNYDSSFFIMSKRAIKCCYSFPYRDEIRESIWRYKFRDRKHYAVFYAQRMAETIKSLCSEEIFTVITFVPLSKKRLKSRTYNQAELIAIELGKILDIPVKSLLIKVKENKIQHSLARKERINNIKNVYEVIDSKSIKNENIILVDDIATTGSTLGECARMLFKAKAHNVTCAVIARVE